MKTKSQSNDRYKNLNIHKYIYLFCKLIIKITHIDEPIIRFKYIAIFKYELLE